MSGTATYSTRLEITDDQVVNAKGLYLDLGDVKEVAVVKLNGVAVDTLWKTPYITEISTKVKPGENLLEIAVTNLWHNRLVGDAGKEGSDRITRTNIQTRYRSNMPLLPSGLIGPVTLKRK